MGFELPTNLLLQDAAIGNAVARISYSRIAKYKSLTPDVPRDIYDSTYWLSKLSTLRGKLGPTSHRRASGHSVAGALRS